MEDGEEQDFGLEEDDPIVIPLPELQVPRNIIEELGKFIAQSVEKEEEMSRIVRDCLDDLYEQFDDPELVTDSVLGYVQRRHGWDMEVVLSEADVEDFFFKIYDGYDPEIWRKVQNTEAIKELHYEVWKLTQHFGREAIREVVEGRHRHPTRHQPKKKRRKLW